MSFPEKDNFEKFSWEWLSTKLRQAGQKNLKPQKVSWAPWKTKVNVKNV